jgi:aerobic-type carbon monoxide dehydrogenase small subunit (CoxS/CutS family)
MAKTDRDDADNTDRRGLGPISRRDFAIGSAAILGAAGAEMQAKTIVRLGGGPAAVPAVTPGLSASDSARSIRLTVNGWKYEVKVEPEWVLRDVLRGQLGLLSIKDMCNGHGACGSCTVLINGRPVLSCMTLACECDGANIETAEGVAVSSPRLIDAYVMNHCMQCGYCTPGFVVTAKALLDRIANPTEDEIRDALGGNICRCGTYPQHILAVREAATGQRSEGPSTAG